MAEVEAAADVGLEAEAERKRDKREWIAIAACIGLLTICGPAWKANIFAGVLCVAGAIVAAGFAAEWKKHPAPFKEPVAPRPVLFDEAGLAHPDPLPPERYEDRPIVWVRYLLFVVALSLVYFAFTFHTRADDRYEEDRAKLWSEHYDHFSDDFEGRILPAVDAVIAGDDGQIDEMFIFGWPYAEMQYISVAEVINEDEFWLQLAEVPEVYDIIHVEADWDRALTGMLASNGRSVTDMDALRAARDGDFLATLRAMEEESRVALNRRHESLRRGRLLATIEGWASLLLILPVIAGAEWIRVATRREVERDNAAYQAALAEYERLEAQWLASDAEVRD